MRLLHKIFTTRSYGTIYDVLCFTLLIHDAIQCNGDTILYNRTISLYHGCIFIYKNYDGKRSDCRCLCLYYRS